MRVLLLFIICNFFVLFITGQTFNRIMPIPPTPQPCIFGSCAPVVKTSDGGYIFNYSYGYANWDVAGPIFSEIVKTDSLFIPQWRKDLAGENGKKTFSYSDGSSIIYTKGNGVGLEKINNAGQTVWLKRYTRTYPYALLINNVTSIANSNIKLAGCVMRYNGFGYWDYSSSLILEVDTAGNFVHADSLIVNGSSSLINDITTDASGNTYILGGGFMAKIMAGNTVSWCKQISSSPNAPSYQLMKILNNGDILIGGSAYNSNVGTSAMVLSRFTTTGAHVWTKTVDYPSLVGGMQELPNNNIIITGALRAFYGDTMKNIIIKIDPNCNQLWAKTYHEGFSISPPYQKSSNNWYYAAHTNQPTLFNTDSLGNTNCPTLNFNLNIHNFSVTTNSLSLVLVPITLSSSTTTSNPTSTQPYVDACSYSPASVNEFDSFNKITVSPNPSKGIFTLKTVERISGIEITNYLGQIIYQEKTRSEYNPIDLSDQPKGIYFITVTESNKTASSKIIIAD